MSGESREKGLFTYASQDAEEQEITAPPNWQEEAEDPVEIRSQASEQTMLAQRKAKYGKRRDDSNDAAAGQGLP